MKAATSAIAAVAAMALIAVVMVSTSSPATTTLASLFSIPENQHGRMALRMDVASHAHAARHHTPNECKEGTAGVKVKLMKATGLAKKDWMSGTDPYAKIFLEGKGETRMTTTKWNNHNPVFNKVFCYHGAAAVKAFKATGIKVTLMDEDMMNADQLIGDVVVKKEGVSSNLDLVAMSSFTGHEGTTTKSQGKVSIEVTVFEAAKAAAPAPATAPAPAPSAVAAASVETKKGRTVIKSEQITGSGPKVQTGGSSATATAAAVSATSNSFDPNSPFSTEAASKRRFEAGRLRKEAADKVKDAASKRRFEAGRLRLVKKKKLEAEAAAAAAEEAAAKKKQEEADQKAKDEKDAAAKKKLDEEAAAAAAAAAVAAKKAASAKSGLSKFLAATKKISAVDAFDEAGKDQAAKKQTAAAAEAAAEEAAAAAAAVAAESTKYCAHKCTEPRERKDYALLSTAERATYKKALKLFHAEGLHHVFVRIHQNGINDPFAHETSGFLPWHRKYLWEMENALRCLGEEFQCLTIPYWDWAEWQHFCNDSDDECDNYMTIPSNMAKALGAKHPEGEKGIISILKDFGGPGTTPPEEGKKKYGSAGSIQLDGVACVTTGPFAGFHDWDGHCLSRGIDWGLPSKTDGIENLPLTTNTYLLDIMVENSKYGKYDGYRYKLQGQPHNNQHNYLGGHMRSMRSPMDPYVEKRRGERNLPLCGGVAVWRCGGVAVWRCAVYGVLVCGARSVLHTNTDFDSPSASQDLLFAPRHGRQAVGAVAGLPRLREP